MEKDKYIFEEGDRKALENHINEFRGEDIFNQVSYVELLTMKAWDEVVKWHKEGKDIVEYVKIRKHHILMS